MPARAPATYSYLASPHLLFGLGALTTCVCGGGNDSASVVSFLVQEVEGQEQVVVEFSHHEV